jgi:hypothetical protein
MEPTWNRHGSDVETTESDFVTTRFGASTGDGVERREGEDGRWRMDDGEGRGGRRRRGWALSCIWRIGGGGAAGAGWVGEVTDGMLGAVGLATFPPPVVMDGARCGILQYVSNMYGVTSRGESAIFVGTDATTQATLGAVCDSPSGWTDAQSGLRDVWGYLGLSNCARSSFAVLAAGVLGYFSMRRVSFSAARSGRLLAM